MHYENLVVYFQFLLISWVEFITSGLITDLPVTVASCGDWIKTSYPNPITSSFYANTSTITVLLNLSKFRIPCTRSEYAKRHNIYSASKLWNTEIPTHLKASTSIKCFFTKKSHFFSLIYFSVTYFFLAIKKAHSTSASVYTIRSFDWLSSFTLYYIG